MAQAPVVMTSARQQGKVLVYIIQRDTQVRCQRRDTLDRVLQVPLPTLVVGTDIA
jgi:hypothetical protein